MSRLNQQVTSPFIGEGIIFAYEKDNKDGLVYTARMDNESFIKFSEDGSLIPLIKDQTISFFDGVEKEERKIFKSDTIIPEHEIIMNVRFLTDYIYDLGAGKIIEFKKRENVYTAIGYDLKIVETELGFNAFYGETKIYGFLSFQFFYSLIKGI